MTAPAASDTGEMTFLEHLQELRRRVRDAALVVGVAFFACYAWHVEIFDLVSAPIQDGLIRHGIYRFRAIAVTEPIMVYLKVSLAAAVALTSPFLIWQLWRFIAPGLLRHEKRLALPVVFFASFFFLLGVAFCYRVMLPFLTDFLVGVGEETASVAVDVTLDSALGYALTFLLMFGVVFELPLALFFMTVVGAVTPMALVRFSRYWVLVAFVLGAMLTPPDPISQLILAVPLIVLYAVGVLASFAAWRYGRGGASSRLHDPEAAAFGPLWSVTGGVLLSLLVVGFAWALRPPSEPDPLDLVDTASPAVFGMQPRVLDRVGAWSALRADLARDLPELAPLLRDGGDPLDTILVQTDLRGNHVAVLAGEGVHDRVRRRLALGMDSRREGKATVYGSGPALRVGLGTLVACLDRACLVGPAEGVMERVRAWRTGQRRAGAQEALEVVRRAGPLWGRLDAAALAAVDPARWPSAPDAASRIRVWLAVDGDRIDGVGAVVEPGEGAAAESLEAALRGLRWAAPRAGAEPVVLGADDVLRVRLLTAPGPTPENAAVEPLRPPDWSVLLAPVSGAAEADGDRARIIDHVGGGGLAVDALRAEGAAIEVRWRRPGVAPAATSGEAADRP